MAGQVKFELVSPAKILLSESVDMVVIPGTEGDFGVLPNHAPLISSIRPGMIRVFEGTVIAEKIFIAGGFAEVTPERCTVLADEAVNVSALDRAAVEAELNGINGELAGFGRAAEQNVDAAATLDGAELARFRTLQRAQSVAIAKLQAQDTRTGH
jgi:F-type H+-transporting ATPase subunit epsilon